MTLALLFLPIYFRLVFSLARAAANKKWMVARQSFSTSSHPMPIFF